MSNIEILPTKPSATRPITRNKITNLKVVRMLPHINTKDNLSIHDWILILQAISTLSY